MCACGLELCCNILHPSTPCHGGFVNRSLQAWRVLIVEEMGCSWAASCADIGNRP